MAQYVEKIEHSFKNGFTMMEGTFENSMFNQLLKLFLRRLNCCKKAVVKYCRFQHEDNNLLEKEVMYSSAEEFLEEFLQILERQELDFIGADFTEDGMIDKFNFGNGWDCWADVQIQ